MSDLDTLVVEKVRMARGVREHIEKHAQREYDKGGYEAVGLLGGRKGEIQSVIEFNNHAPDRSKAFFVEPWEQFQAEQAMEGQGMEILGVYHSHPISEARPSRSDTELARDGELTVIFSVAFGEINAWRCNDRELNRVDLKYFDIDDIT